ncbi:4Fe-4S dicluster domain-containing protein [candidate division KSB1 bacterium]|nr:4Fe-4S dicluster domain-containing protein [candidate division KSB1 bacterium]
MSRPRYGFLIDLRRCIGCHTCSVACKNENAVPLGVWRSWVKQIEKGEYPNVTRSFLPLLCNNCKDPICVTVCPTFASQQREDGIVTIDPHRCIGCRYCMAACPYGVRFINPILQICQKCDWCVHRVERGIQPACVDACPSNARVFGDLNDPESDIAKMIADNSVSVLKPIMGTGPQAYYIALDITAVNAKSEGQE